MFYEEDLQYICIYIIHVAPSANQHLNPSHIHNFHYAHEYRYTLIEHSCVYNIIYQHDFVYTYTVILHIYTLLYGKISLLCLNNKRKNEDGKKKECTQHV